MYIYFWTFQTFMISDFEIWNFLKGNGFQSYNIQDFDKGSEKF